MACVVKIRVIKARNLPIMDQRKKSTDAYVEVKLLSNCYTTDTKWSTLSPEWNFDIRQEVQDITALMDEPVEFKVWDHDTVQDDPVGCVLIHLGHTAAGAGEESKIRLNGWFPIYDSLRGICGELQLGITIEVIGDFVKSSESPLGVTVLSVSSLPKSHRLQRVYGFVEEISFREDPEHHWIETFAYSRTTNDARQLHISSLASKIKKRLCEKVVDLGGNALIGYHLNLDFGLEKELVGVGYGTACRIELVEDDEGAELPPSPSFPAAPTPPAYIYAQNRSGSQPSTPLSASLELDSPFTEGKTRLRREGSLRDEISSSRLLMSKAFQDVQLLTMTSLPNGCIIRIGGLIGARAVKLMPSKRTDLAEDFEDWWKEIREEIQSHAKELCCYHIMGYSESFTIDRDVFVLSVTGTAVLLDTNHRLVRIFGKQQHESLPRDSYEDGQTKMPRTRRQSKSGKFSLCSMFHAPYSRRRKPFPIDMQLCQICNKKFTPSILLSTIDLPTSLSYTGSVKLIEARICRPKKKVQGEANATIISDSLPFLENDLYTQLLTKLRIIGRNAIFGLKSQFVIGDNLIIATFSGTAVNLDALPPAPMLKLFQNIESMRERDRPVIHDLYTYSKLNLPTRVQPSSVPDLSNIGPKADTKAKYYADADGVPQSESSSSDDSSSSESESSSDDDSDTSYLIDLDEKTATSELLVFRDMFQHDQTKFCTVDTPFSHGLKPSRIIQHVSSVFRFEWSPNSKTPLSLVLWNCYQKIQERILFRLQGQKPVAISNIRTSIQALDDFEIQIFFSGTIVKLEQSASGTSSGDLKLANESNPVEGEGSSTSGLVWIANDVRSHIHSVNP
eukprot:TRINITY_DN2172_c0_g1_i3.p1 TRINITY_DN2172_c0_g1~~TRINITY_DN2172_c0_g1_i3.p1  ORF type:complete len:846 (+),score=137.47 TRINITY_DN2172_c0_g1_i3:51-2588(+)